MKPEKKISTHSLTRRLTDQEAEWKLYQEHFNSQPHKEADAGRQNHARLIRYFNSQPHKEADNKKQEEA